jgi:sirohydrochlorin cobaltochelatase
VSREDFSDAALVVLGHGSTKNVESAAPVFQHTAELERRNIFAEVRPAFWKQDPQIKNVLAGLSAPRIFIAPLFISEGYFTTDVMPKALGFAPGRCILETSGRKLFFCLPVGTHDSITAVLLARAREVVARFPFPRAPKPTETALVIAGHGTEQNENSRRAIERQAELIRATGEYAEVHAVFLEEEPRIEAGLARVRTGNVVVVPLFISDGMHTQEDIPVLLGAPKHIVKRRLDAGQPAWRNPSEHDGKLIWYAAAIGTEPKLADVILERVREAANAPIA